MPQSGIQGTFAMSWSAPFLGSSIHQSPTERTNSTVVTTSAVHLAERSSPSKMGTTPRSGSTSRAWRIHCPKPIECRKAVIARSPDHGAEDPDCAHEEEDDVDAHLAGLQEPEAAAREP